MENEFSGKCDVNLCLLFASTYSLEHGTLLECIVSHMSLFLLIRDPRKNCCFPISSLIQKQNGSEAQESLSQHCNFKTDQTFTKKIKRFRCVSSRKAGISLFTREHYRLPDKPAANLR